MKKYIRFLLLSLFISPVLATTTHIQNTENNHNYDVLKITLDGNSKIVVSAVKSGDPAQSLKTLMNNVGGTHAINGAFFCPKESAYSRCQGNTTEALRISNGTLLSKRGEDIGTNQSVFGFDNQSNPLPLIDNTTRTRTTTRRNPALDNVQNGIMMQTLVKEGTNVAINNDAMNNDAKQSKAANKTFICSSQNNTTIYMGYVDNVTFSSLADYIIQTFDCYNAIQLDNGGSKAMIYNNQYIAGPGRNIMDAFVVIESKETSEEIKNAIIWMYDNGLSKYNTPDDFMVDNTMNREQAAKFFSVFAKTIKNKAIDIDKDCTFLDIKQADPTLQTNIIESCQLGIFQGYKNNFMPKDTLNRAQTITVLIRILEGNLPEEGQYYLNYYTRTKELGLVDTINPSDNITRGSAALLLQQASLLSK